MKTGEKIQSILVKDFEGRDVDLMAVYKGKPLLLIIYNNQCLGCTGRGIPLAYEFHKEYDALQVVGIHSDFGLKKTTEAEIKSIFTLGELPFSIYLDEQAAVFHQFESEGTPQWILITAMGVLYRSIFGSQAGAQNRLAYALEDMM
ncbi:MAG: redoxin domain-containing protein [Bacteroidaceae bacterium]